jgi:hypothetical protein
MFPDEQLLESLHFQPIWDRELSFLQKRKKEMRVDQKLIISSKDFSPADIVKTHKEYTSTGFLGATHNISPFQFNPPTPDSTTASNTNTGELNFIKEIEQGVPFVFGNQKDEEIIPEKNKIRRDNKTEKKIAKQKLLEEVISLSEEEKEELRRIPNKECKTHHYFIQLKLFEIHSRFIKK